MEEDGRTIARLPFSIKKRYGISVLTMPPLTPWLGPWIAPVEGSYRKELQHQHEMIRRLVRQMPAASRIAIQCSPDFTNLHAFASEGFRLSLSYTYRMDDLSDLDRTWNSFKVEVRRNIRKAEKKLTVDVGHDIGAFADTLTKMFARKGMEGTAGRLIKQIEQADEKLAALGLSKIFVARLADGRPVGAQYVVEDRRFAYKIAGGTDPDYFSLGTDSLLTWSVIKDASASSRGYDFQGSMIPSIEKFILGFGARQTPRYMAIKESLGFRLYNAVKQAYT